MKTKLIIISLLLLAAQLGFSQEAKKGSKIKYTNWTELNCGMGAGTVRFSTGYIVNNLNYSIGLKTVNGIKLNEHFSFGIGLGFDKYTDGNIIPLSLETSITLKKAAISPIINFGIGYYRSNVPALTGGMCYTPSIGIKTNLKPNMDFYFTVGAKVMNTIKHYEDFYNGQVDEILYYKLITINTGLVF